MIGKQEILHISNVRRINPHVIEKDYILGWILAGIYHNATLKNSWIFKGGTCLKKCHFDTYRFSEDLDFTVVKPSHLSSDFLTETFTEICDWLHDEFGLEIPPRLLSFEIFTNPRGSKSCRGKIGYRGPVNPQYGYRSLPRLKIDLTFDEILVLPSTERTIHHNYSDDLPEELVAQCYAIEEIAAEKICAMGQRVRPRDLYDLVNLFRNDEARPNRIIINEILLKKCAHRNITVPKLSDIQVRDKDFEMHWSHMLSHQLQELPPIESYFSALSKFFDWLQTGAIHSLSPIAQIQENETILRESSMNLHLKHDAKVWLEVIRFAAINHLCVDLTYEHSVHCIEPYSLHCAKDGKIILHAIRISDKKHFIYQIENIESARVTTHSYIPRYQIELRPLIQPS
ncbi:MAG: nucleotidyl transferase AbiEii/AbiGii toxin family protein [Bacteroidetes bacterium]|nr:nucleotidyl transferase AbiEii/AbiGii toxin family protein [Bacteroidota bacterium]MCY4206227.1 nucleotidyl transferase AbiEii/AbiGii toxin family protein [Bacteroidota bacterium]